MTHEQPGSARKNSSLSNLEPRGAFSVTSIPLQENDSGGLAGREVPVVWGLDGQVAGARRVW
jgi:hypothetical protein